MPQLRVDMKLHFARQFAGHAGCACHADGQVDMRMTNDMAYVDPIEHWTCTTGEQDVWGQADCLQAIGCVGVMSPGEKKIGCPPSSNRQNAASSEEETGYQPSSKRQSAGRLMKRLAVSQAAKDRMLQA